MNSKSYQNLEKIFLTWAILCIIFPLVSLVLHSPNFQPNNYMEEDLSEKLHISPTTGLSHDEWTEIHGYANDYIDWSFSTSPSQVINVWVLDYVNYLQFISTGFASGHHLTTSASGSGRFDVSSFLGQTWYVLFWNDLSGSQYTTVTYNAVFEGDPPPPNKKIFITKPDSTSELILGSQSTIEWHTSGDIITDVQISIYKGQSKLGTIASRVDNDGSYSWTVLWYSSGGYDYYRLDPGSNYRIHIKDINSIAYNMSDYFSIITDSLTIIEPNSNSSYRAGEPIEITWISDNVYDYLDIELCKRRNDGGYDRIAYDINVPNTGYYYWSDTNDLPSGSYFFRIYPEYYGTPWLDQSDYFTIVNESSIPSYSIILIIGISSLMSSILIYHHLKTRKNLEK